MKTETEIPENVGVSNPYALAEVMMKRRVNWKKVSDPQKLLEKTLGMPYEKLFDPKHGSPLYPGLRFLPKTKCGACRDTHNSKRCTPRIA